MPFDCPVCGKYAPGGRRFCSKPCSKKVKRMCRRIGCTETWHATEQNRKRYCRNCIPQSYPNPIYPYKLNKQCVHCGERFTVEIHNEEERTSKTTCESCSKVFNSRAWKCMRLLAESGISSTQLNKMDIETINWFYEELRETDAIG
mgnify:FL=1